MISLTNEFIRNPEPFNTMFSHNPNTFIDPSTPQKFVSFISPYKTNIPLTLTPEYQKLQTELLSSIITFGKNLYIEILNSHFYSPHKSVTTIQNIEVAHDFIIPRSSNNPLLVNQIFSGLKFYNPKTFYISEKEFIEIKSDHKKATSLKI